MTALWLWVGCTNRPPVLEALNGQPAKDPLIGVEYVPSFEVRAGQTIELRVDARDPDGDAVEIRFSDMPGIVTFDPHGTTGTLEVFEQQADTGFVLADAVIVLLDDHDPPAWVENELFFFYESDDTGR